ncbi:MAG TPA: extracellular solute-binding protein [Xanthobacteraceae bacterium]|nr:extracellular solute-binding protein [Xanthobacteraceae bacterium]
MSPLAALLGVIALSGIAIAEAAEPRHAIAMHGEPAMPEEFTRVRYANPAAPKGGRLVHGVLGTFDSLNPLIVRGLALGAIRGYVVESLMARGYDEPFTLYGLVARSVETDAERSYVTFTLDPAARFSDGKPVTPADVIFSWQLLRDKGRPNHRTYYAKVTKAEAVGERAVRFDLAGSNDRELPLILGLMPVLAKHAIRPETFEETSFEAPLGSGPYVVSAVDPGKSVTFKRNPDYWGRDLAISRGFWNFDEIRFDYYRDANSHLEAFKRGLYDFRNEHDPTRWQTGYDFPALRDGRVLKEELATGVPKASSVYVFNTRRAIFSDIRVREAISLLFDFEWINHGYFFDLYRRTASYFEGSELSSHRRPADARERALLAPFAGAVRADVLDGTWSPPVSDGSGRDRVMLRRALDLFAAAGYELRGTALIERRTGRPFTFEIMVASRDDERLALLFSQSLKRAGIVARVRSVDAVQYDGRKLAYDFDMIENRWDQSLSPGNEQAFYWGSAAADAPGTRNYMGVKSPAVDAMIAALLRAESHGDFVSAVRALDRVLISGVYVVPLFHLPAQWIARWTTVGRPPHTSIYGYLPETWWREPRSQ